MCTLLSKSTGSCEESILLKKILGKEKIYKYILSKLILTVNENLWISILFLERSLYQEVKQLTDKRLGEVNMVTGQVHCEWQTPNHGQWL